MDKYEYRVRAEEINALIDKKEYAEAVKIADTIDWRRVKSVMMLCKVSDLYKMNRRYEDSKDVLLLAYDRHPGGRKIIYSLCELCIKLEEIVQAVEYYKEFVQVAPRDTGRFILQYRLYEAQDVSLEERIAVLEEYKKRDYREKWAYELAYLYHRIGLATRCVEECDELILWFGEGRYVVKAMELKMLHEPLTPTQQEKYDRCRSKKTVVNKAEEAVLAAGQTAHIDIEGESIGDTTLPISIKSVEVSNAPTTKIPSRKVQEELDETEQSADTDEEMMSDDEIEEAEEIAATQALSQDEVNEQLSEDVGKDEPEESAEATEQEVSQEELQAEETQPNEEVKEDDIDIQIKPIDVGEYNTINLQQELAKNLAKMLAEEDMEAMDATKALPIDTILESTDPNLINGITNDSIKNAIVAPLLQDTAELTPITEEDLLASLDEKPKTIDELNQEEAQALATKPIGPVFNEETIAEESTAEEIATEEFAAKDVPVPVQQEPIESQQEQEPSSEMLSREELMKVISERAAVARRGVTEPESNNQEVEPQLQENKAEEVTYQQAMEAVMPKEEQVTQVSQEPTEQEIVEEPVLKEQPSDEILLQSEQALNPEQPMVNEQITGQLSFTDIMAEWEETKKANEEKHREEMRQRMLKQTGPMFEDFDAAARASVSSNLDLISPMEDVFSDTQKLATEVENALEADSKESEHQSYSGITGNIFGEAPISLQQEEQPTEDLDEEPIQTRIFNTAEIRSIEEQLLNNLQKENNKVEPELVVPVIPQTESIPPIPETVEVPMTQPTLSSLPEHVPKPDVYSQEMPATSDSIFTQQELTEAAKEQTPPPLPKMNAMVTTADIEFTDLTALETPQVTIPPVGRDLTPQERELFSTFAQTKEIEHQITNAIDRISLIPNTGNVLISGAQGTGTVNVAKNLIKMVQATNSRFSHKVAKITGSILDKKDIKATLGSLENGALIVEKAGDLTPHVCENIINYLEGLSQEHGFLILLEDTKLNIDKLVSACPQMALAFNIRIDVAAIDNDGLVNFGKDYAKEQEYAIDDMGMLALYTRIADMQTIDHHVTVDEVKDIIDEAISSANKKSVSHIVDVLFAKRYDSEDMIVLREKDFLKDR